MGIAMLREQAAGLTRDQRNAFFAAWLGYLLDGLFNLAGALTGQSILLVGMMTEAVVTPWLSDRDIALQNVRYVLNACGNLHEDFVPAPGGFIQQRANHVLGEAIDLLGRIADDIA